LSFVAGLNFECCEKTVGLNVSHASYGSMIKLVFFYGLNFQNFNVNSSKRNKESDGKVLYSMGLAASDHKWTSWDYCSDNHFVIGFGSKRLNPTGVLTG